MSAEAAGSSKRKRSKSVQFPRKKSRREIIDDEIEQVLREKSQQTEMELLAKKAFEQLPLSSATKRALQESYYYDMTEIQRKTIVLSLSGDDIVAAAKTGSGKTLAFVIPIVEKLFLSKWNRYDGVGALILTPTRELALQIFEVVKKISGCHDFVSALIVGGVLISHEWRRIDQCNIIVATPGRLLHHLVKNPIFDCGKLQMLVLDEADQILNTSFKKDVNEIVENLPRQRQTLLFSATQTKRVSDFFRLSLRNPRMVEVDASAKYATPDQLEQFFMECQLEEKVNVLWTFIKRHINLKSIVFFSNCKQVKYFSEVFRSMRISTVIYAIHGNMKQWKRTQIYETFCSERKGVLFATDLVARGLDFPAVHWVVQYDAPEETKAYIHRVGRTARSDNAGKSLLLLMPCERFIFDELAAQKIPIKQMRFNSNTLVRVDKKLNGCLVKNTELSSMAKRAFTGYLKSSLWLKNKKNFDYKNLDLEAFANSLGLAMVPRISSNLSQRLGLSTSVTKSIAASATSDANEIIRKESVQFTTKIEPDPAVVAAQQRLVKPITEIQRARLLRKTVKHSHIKFGDGDGCDKDKNSAVKTNDGGNGSEEDADGDEWSLDYMRKLIKEKDALCKQTFKKVEREKKIKRKIAELNDDDDDDDDDDDNDDDEDEDEDDDDDDDNEE